MRRAESAVRVHGHLAAAAPAAPPPMEAVEGRAGPAGRRLRFPRQFGCSAKRDPVSFAPPIGGPRHRHGLRGAFDRREPDEAARPCRSPSTVRCRPVPRRRAAKGWRLRPTGTAFGAPAHQGKANPRRRAAVAMGWRATGAPRRGSRHRRLRRVVVRHVARDRQAGASAQVESDAVADPSSPASCGPRGRAPFPECQADHLAAGKGQARRTFRGSERPAPKPARPRASPCARKRRSCAPGTRESATECGFPCDAPFAVSSEHPKGRSRRPRPRPHSPARPADANAGATWPPTSISVPGSRRRSSRKPRTRPAGARERTRCPAVRHRDRRSWDESCTGQGGAGGGDGQADRPRWMRSIDRAVEGTTRDRAARGASGGSYSAASTAGATETTLRPRLRENVTFPSTSAKMV